ncbi:helix-turn-helix domain-containing protein [Pseudovibrio ascidiaceicola]|uniref:helix-turn-helix domain-containing protein n=1 Tax=Pseudovibrio ascidiaceicola TaxID=285279 RepID=UPI003D3686B0
MMSGSTGKIQHCNSLTIQYSDKAVWISKLCRDHNFSASEKVGGIALCDYFNTKTGDAWPSISRLEQDAGTSRRTVIRALKKVSVVWAPRFNFSFLRQTSNLYCWRF